MNPLTVANAVANGIVIVSVAGMAIRVFGDATHQIHSHRELFWIRKFISSLIISGAVLNLCTLSTPSWTETLLNYGFATNYLFSLYYHDRFTRTTNSKNAAALPKRGATSRSGSTRKTAARSASGGTGRKRSSSR
jgi:hypothetical protein